MSGGFIDPMSARFSTFGLMLVDVDRTYPERENFLHAVRHGRCDAMTRVLQAEIDTLPASAIFSLLVRIKA